MSDVVWRKMAVLSARLFYFVNRCRSTGRILVTSPVVPHDCCRVCLLKCFTVCYNPLIMNQSDNTYKRLLEVGRKYLSLSIEELKLTMAEKVTVLISTAAVVAIVGALSILLFLFITLAVVNWLATVMPIALAYAIVAVFFLICGVIVFLLRKSLIVDPIARFISRLFLS